jgi:cohesin complex subunit SA-1/2
MHSSRSQLSSTTKTTTTKQSQTAIITMAKKILDPIELANRDSSLTAALLYSSLSSSNGRRKKYHNNKLSAKDIPSIARDVVDAIQKNSAHAQIDLLNLIFRSVGCRYEHLMKYDIDLDELSDDDLTDIIEQLVDDMSDTAPDCVLFCADPNGSFGTRPGGLVRPKVAINAYRCIYQDFWYELGIAILSDRYKSSSNNKSNEEHSMGEKEDDVQSKSNSGIDIARSLISRLMDFVGVGVPDIRAAVSMAIYKVAQALLQSTVQWKTKLDVATRQYQSATRVSKSSLKSKALKEQVDQLTQSINGAEEIMKGSVMNVFLKRYRDNNEYIRSESLNALSKFSLIRPDLYLSGMYLKYFGWLLSDKNEHVRLAAVHGLLAPFQENQLREDSATTIGNKSNALTVEPVDISGMSSVISKFLSRLADMVLDVDVTVQEGAMELLLYLVRNDFFSDVDNDNIWNQINLRAIATDTSPLVRRDALYFVMEQLQQFDTGSSTSDVDAVERIKALVEWISHILSDSEIPIENIRYRLTDYLVSSMRAMEEHKSLASNWSAILQCLKVDGINFTPNRKISHQSIEVGDQRQDAVQQRVLLRFLVASADLEVYSLSGGTIPNSMTQEIDRDVLNIEREQHLERTIVSSKKKNRHTSTSQEELTFALLRALPDLLVSFKSESPVLQNLTSLSRYLCKY